MKKKEDQQGSNPGGKQKGHPNTAESNYQVRTKWQGNPRGRNGTDYLLTRYLGVVSQLGQKVEGENRGRFLRTRE
jgi:hypothetical protein